MQIAVCCSDENELERVSALIDDLCARTKRKATAVTFRSEDVFWAAFWPGRFHGIIIGYGDVKGFLCARRVREEDSSCRVILLDDTDRYAIRSLRIHLSDYLVRPMEDERLRSAVGRLLTE